MKPQFSNFTNKFEFRTGNPRFGCKTRWIERWFKKQFRILDFGEFKNTPLTKMKDLK